MHVVLSRKQTRTNLDKKIISSNKLRGSFQPDTIIHPATAITNTAGRTVPRTFLFNHSFGSSYTAHTTAQSLSMESSVPISVSPAKKQLSFSNSQLSCQLAANVSSIVDKRKRSSTREAISNRSGNDNSRRRVPSLSKSMSAYDSLLCLSSLKHWQRINELNKRRAASTSLTQSLQVVAVLRHSFHAWKYLVSNRNESRDQSTNSVKNLHIRFELHRLIDTWSQAYHNRVNNSMSQNSLKRLFGRWHLTTTRSYTKRKQSQLLKKYLFKWKRFHITYKNLLTSHASNLVKQHTRSRQLITFETWKHKLRVIQAEQTLVHIRLRKYFHTWRNFHSKYLISKSVSLPLYPDDQYREYLICWRIATTYRRSVAFHMIVAPKFRKWLKLHREIQINKKTALQTANYQLKKKSVRDC